MSLLDIIDEVPEISALIALELKRLSSPTEDEVSTNEAHRIYGRRWVERFTKLGELHPLYRGNKRVYSRSELERVRAKDTISARLLVKPRA